MSLLSIIRNQNKNRSTVSNKETPVFNPKEAAKEKTTYAFEDMTEFLIYVALHKDEGKDIVWGSSDEYITLFQEGYECFEKGDFAGAEKKYLEAIAINPVAIKARFELSQTYVREGKLNAAKAMLDTLPDLIRADKSAIAAFYRFRGYIESEERNFRCAAACYRYSLNFEDSKIAYNELQYISKNGGPFVLKGTPENILPMYNIHVFPVE